MRIPIRLIFSMTISGCQKAVILKTSNIFHCPKHSKVSIVGMSEKVTAFEKKPRERAF